MNKLDHTSDPQSLTRIFVPGLSSHIEELVEQHRLSYEQLHGATELDRYFTTMRPLAEQRWLLAKYPQQYWAGMPAFMRSFMEQLIADKRHQGRLDDLPEEWIQAIASGQLTR